MNRYIIYTNASQAGSNFWKELNDKKLKNKQRVKLIENELIENKKRQFKKTQFQIYWLEKNEKIKKAVDDLDCYQKIIIRTSKYII